MSAIAATAIVYGIFAMNSYDRAKFQAGSQPHQPMRVVSCPLNEYGRPQNCSVRSTPISVTQKVEHWVNPVAQDELYERVNPLPLTE
jgi:hypothetical protein